MAQRKHRRDIPAGPNASQLLIILIRSGRARRQHDGRQLPAVIAFFSVCRPPVGEKILLFLVGTAPQRLYAGYPRALQAFCDILGKVEKPTAGSRRFRKESSIGWI